MFVVVVSYVIKIGWITAKENIMMPFHPSTTMSGVLDESLEVDDGTGILKGETLSSIFGMSDMMADKKRGISVGCKKREKRGNNRFTIIVKGGSGQELPIIMRKSGAAVRFSFLRRT